MFKSCAYLNSGYLIHLKLLKITHGIIARILPDPINHKKVTKFIIINRIQTRSKQYIKNHQILHFKNQKLTLRYLNKKKKISLISPESQLNAKSTLAAGEISDEIHSSSKKESNSLAGGDSSSADKNEKWNSLLKETRNG